VFERVDKRPRLKLEATKDIELRHLSYRFLAGTFTSVVAGALSMIFNARVGGVMLAFPAILAASLTLIESEEAAADAREDARGAIVGAVALVAFAAVAALTLTHVGGPIALLLAAVSWALVALLGYVVLWSK